MSKEELKKGGRKPSPRQRRYGKLVRGWDWRTDPELLAQAEKRRIELNVSRTQFLEHAIKLLLEKTK